MPSRVFLVLGCVVALALLPECSSEFNPSGGGPGNGSSDGGATADLFQYPKGPDGPTPNWDAFFANDPPPQYCGPDGGWTPPPLPGGTPECPDDKNREGCPCKKMGEKAACWPGLRANRNHGICKDGETECRMIGEITLRWGPCVGYVLPKPGYTKGAEACKCFSKGQWQIKNLSPCFITYGDKSVHAVSTYVDGTGQAKCPDVPNVPPPPTPSAPFSENTLTVDCAGQFELCFTLKAGDYQNPTPQDCVLAKTCTTEWYPTKNVAQVMPPLPGWSSTDATCVNKFMTTGGYGELSVVGKSIDCEVVDDNGDPLVFHRMGYCPMKCNDQPDLPECQNCGNGASGTF